MIGPGYFNIDTTVYKNIEITERVKFTIGSSAYNVLNHAHFADPPSNVASGALGRHLQHGLKSHQRLRRFPGISGFRP